MLSRADRRWIRRDRALPGLATVIDGEALVGALRARHPRLDGMTLRPRYVRYKPGTRCLVAYDVEGLPGIPAAYAVAHGPDAPDKLRPGRGGSRARGAVHVLESRGIAVHLFPADARLPALARLGDPASSVGLLARTLPGSSALWETSFRELAYKPERRFVAALEADAAPEAVVKLYTGPGYRVAEARQRVIEHVAFGARAERIGRSRKHGVLAFAWIAGPALQDLIESRDGTGPIAETGALLAELHARLPAPGSMRSLPWEPRLREAGALLASLVPDLGARPERLARRLASRLREAETPGALLHGDFYAKQVVLGPRGPVFLDFDQLAWGPRLADLGCFLAHVERDVIRGRIGPARARTVREALLEGYEKAGGGVPPALLDAWTASEILGTAVHHFRNREPDWPERIEAGLVRAEALEAAESFRVAVPARGLAAGRREDPRSRPVDPILARALDPGHAARALARSLGVPGLRVPEVELLRCKAGRRALVRYRAVAGGAGGPCFDVSLVGKLRFRGADRTTADLTRSLWRASFGPGTPDGIEVPEPWGVVPELHLWLQRFVSGVALTDVLDTVEGPALTARAAEALYKLGRAGPTPRRRHTPHDELAILRRRLENAARSLPALAPRIRRLLSGCEALAPVLDPEAMVPIHRDFYPDQLFVSGSRLVLLDLDLYCLGDPALDAGNFLAHLTELALRCHADPRRYRECERAFEARFLRDHGSAYRPRVRAYRVLSLARHVSIAREIPERRRWTGAVLELALAELSAWRGDPARSGDLPQEIHP